MLLRPQGAWEAHGFCSVCFSFWSGQHWKQRCFEPLVDLFLWRCATMELAFAGQPNGEVGSSDHPYLVTKVLSC